MRKGGKRGGVLVRAAWRLNLRGLVFLDSTHRLCSYRRSNAILFFPGNPLTGGDKPWNEERKKVGERLLRNRISKDSEGK